VSEQNGEKRRVDSFEVAAAMREAGLPDAFIVDAIAAARESGGVRGLLGMWLETNETDSERNEIEADIQDLIDDLTQPVGPREEVYVRFDDLEWIAKHIMEFKNSLLAKLGDEDVSLTELSNRTGMPVSSLSRFFNSASMPRRGTLLKIAKAVGFSGVEIATDWDERLSFSYTNSTIEIYIPGRLSSVKESLGFIDNG
jgi:transcriptional regulator with XRE-family HTH domain